MPYAGHRWSWRAPGTAAVSASRILSRATSASLGHLYVTGRTGHLQFVSAVRASRRAGTDAELVPGKRTTSGNRKEVHTQKGGAFRPLLRRGTACRGRPQASCGRCPRCLGALPGLGLGLKLSDPLVAPPAWDQVRVFRPSMDPVASVDQRRFASLSSPSRFVRCQPPAGSVTGLRSPQGRGARRLVTERIGHWCHPAHLTRPRQ
jgi:hypothetical protein